MSHIVTLLWALLAGLRALPRPRRRAPRLVRPGLASQVAPLRAAQGHPPSRQRTPENRPRATPQPSEAEIARAMAQLMDLFAHWQAGTLPPPGPHTLLTGRYRRPAPHAPHRPAPTRHPPRLRALARPMPAARPHALPPRARPAPASPPATRPRHVPSPARAAFRGQAPTRPTTLLFH